MKRSAVLLLAVSCVSSCGRGAPPASQVDPGPPTAAASASAAPAPEAAPASASAAAPPPFRDGARAFDTVRRTLLARYHTGVSEDELYRGAVEGMLRNVEPAQAAYNRLLTPAEFSALQADLKGEVVGVGVQLAFDAETGYARVTMVLPRSPAAAAGIQRGDLLVSVDGKLYKGKTFEALVHDIRGAAGATVTLTILRGEATSRVQVTRAKVAFEVVRRVALGNGVDYLRVREMSEKAVPLLRSALGDARAARTRAIVLDLRGNPGGLFEQAVAVAGLFLPVGTPVVRVQKRDEPEEVVRATGAVVPEVALAVLVDHHTASGGELVAATLHEGRRAPLVGARTFGKWSMQELEALPNGYGIRYTVSMFLTPAGQGYEGVGIAPDVAVDQPEPPPEPEGDAAEARLAADTQLRTAVSLLAAAH